MALTHAGDPAVSSTTSGVIDLGRPARVAKAMAAVARCLPRPLPRPCPGLASPFSFQKENFFGLNVHASHQKRRTISICELKFSRKYIPQVSMSKLHCLFPENIHDDQEEMSLRFPKALLITNMWMLTLPLKVLAETCETDTSFMEMPLLFAIALIGATVGGLLARKRKEELKRLNDQLRQINEALRRQAKIESYAPSLSYAPPVGRINENEVIVDPTKQQLITTLRSGKNFLRNQDPKMAFAQFQEAFELAQTLEDYLEEKKAARGLGASLQRLGKYREAIKYHSRVLEISKRTGEDSGVTEAYGAIADCYTELGDLERAAKFYDKYIARLVAE